MMQDQNLSDFLQRQYLNRWKKQINVLLMKSNETKFNSVTNEIKFYNDLYAELKNVDAQLVKQELRLTLDLIEHRKKKFKYGNLFKQLSVKDSLHKTKNIMDIMNEIPISELETLSTFQEIKEVIQKIFLVLKKLLNLDYSNEKYMQIENNVVQEMFNKVVEIIRQKDILNIPLAEYDAFYNEYKEYVLNSWKEKTGNSRYGEDSSVGSYSNRWKATRRVRLGTIMEPLNLIYNQRKSHQTMRDAIAEINQNHRLVLNKLNIIEFFEVEKFDDIFDKHFKRELDFFDFSNKGQEKKKLAVQRYEAEVEGFEKELIFVLRHLLSNAVNESELYETFVKYTNLLSRERVKNALNEFQNRIMTGIDDSQEDLYRNKFTIVTFARSGAKNIARNFGVYNDCAEYIWTRQIKKCFDSWETKIDRVLQNEDEKQNKTTSFKKLLQGFNAKRNEVKGRVENYLKKKPFGFEGPMLKIGSTGRQKGLRLEVNFPPELQKKFIEIRCALKLNIPKVTMLTTKFFFVKKWPVYCNSTRMIEIVKTWNIISQKLDKRLTRILANLLKKVYAHIENGFYETWEITDSHEGERIAKYFIEFAESVQDLEEAVDFICEKREEIDQLIRNLNSCEIEYKTISDFLTKVQGIIDELILKEFTNMNILVNELNQKIEKIFIKKLNDFLTTWRDEFQGFTPQNAKKQKFRVIQVPTRHEILEKNKTIYIDPPVEAARSFWLDHLHFYMNIIFTQQKIRSNSYEVIADEDLVKQSFAYLVQKMNQQLLAETYNLIDIKFLEADQYVNTWLSYQALWELNLGTITDQLDDDLNQWKNLLNEIKHGRNTFETDKFEKYFGPVEVLFKHVVLKINNLYDRLSNDLVQKFGNYFEGLSRQTNEAILRDKKNLEQVNFSNPAELVNNISIINEVKNKIDDHVKTIKGLKDSEKVLISQKFGFKPGYKSMQLVDSDFHRMRNLFQTQLNIFEKNQETIKETLEKEDQRLTRKINEIENLWNEKKPFSSEMHPDEAIEVLNQLEQKIRGNKDDLDKLNQAKALMKMEVLDYDGVEQILEDSTKLRSLWAELQTLWKRVDQEMETPFEVVNTTMVEKRYNKIIDEIDEMRGKGQNEEILKGKRQELQRLKKVNKLIGTMKSEAMKDHHIQNVFRRMQLTTPMTELLIKDLHDIDLLKHEKMIMEIASSAQGELVLETMLKKIKEFWNIQEFEFSQYQEKCKLIKGFNALMEQAEEDLSQLSSMKLSQHFKAFESDIKNWNDKLNNASNVLSVWMDVQRKYVYLEGIFFGSSDLKDQLPTEYARFQDVDRQFLDIMKISVSKARILAVITSIPNLYRTLENLSDTLEKIQKSLSDYLEKQRQAFSRFYFVGDEDLLEIIGNSRNIMAIQKYFPKMFAGIHSIANEDNGDLLTKMISQKGEIVSLETPIRISENPKINEWLTLLENRMEESLVAECAKTVESWKVITLENYLTLVESYSTQNILLAFIVYWTFIIEETLLNDGDLGQINDKIIQFLGFMAEQVLKDLPSLVRLRYQQLITDMVHKRTVTRNLVDYGKTCSFEIDDFKWQYYMRYYFRNATGDKGDWVEVIMGNATFEYGFEYLGIKEKLVQTPLTDKCYYTLTQALSLRMGGNPFGPAGTGKTESVKMLGASLGRFVLVFNCDEAFNFKAMGRIFIGLCQVGAWGCFDEFNRLEEKILSAVSQQILVIQTGLREHKERIELLGKSVLLNPNMGSFVTMNPGYAGRSNLPENLKQLFRQMAMTKPDSNLIAQVMLFSQGFKSAEYLASKVVTLFSLCKGQLSAQPHYDFGLRSLKSVLNSSGSLKRKLIAKGGEDQHSVDKETRIILRSFTDMVMPKLISDDCPLLENLIKGVFPGCDVPRVDDEKLIQAIEEQCIKRFLKVDNPKFNEKVMQLNQILKLQHGVMLVGPTGCGKSAAWELLLTALYEVDGVKGESYIIDPKAISKEELYGNLDNTTMEWTDGIFTHILRKICENQRGESSKRHWIVFDGDVDPEWAENLNSVLDNNKLLTLPNGERLQLPTNVKIMFEVESLKHATLATVSRCGMVWFSEDILDPEDLYYHYLLRLQEDKYDTKIKEISGQDTISPVRKYCVDSIRSLFISENPEIRSMVSIALDLAVHEKHVMIYSRIRVLEALFALIRQAISRIKEKDENSFDNYFDNNKPIIEKYMKNWVLFSVIWSFVGDLKLHERVTFYQLLADNIGSIDHGISLPSVDDKTSLIDYAVNIESGEFELWRDKVPKMEVSSDKATDADVIITTVDTLRHQEVLCSWLIERRPFIICGPPGSGKTMTLMSTLKNLDDFEMIFVNFSSSTDPTLILKQFEHYCEYAKVSTGFILRPKEPNKWLVLFCDEINLPEADAYGTQAVITFLRQIVEQGGFWRSSDKSWVKTERIILVGACNPPTDAGRNPLAQRFLRHCPLILVDFPGYDSLMQIYGTFNRALLQKVPDLWHLADNLTRAMVEYYSQSQRRFTADMQAHYIYSPRELTRWKYAINEALGNISTGEDLVRLWAHEALRLFKDRLVYDEEKKWCDEKLEEIARQMFPQVNIDKALEKPILFSTYLTKFYQSCEFEKLREFIKKKLVTFNEEELDVRLVVFNEVVSNIAKIDRVLRQPIGHCLLVGASGVGKTTLSKFVSWMNGLRVFQIKAGKNYGLTNFDEDLRYVMKQAGCYMEKITFIFDESNVISVAFLERMNALLASGEIPGLFDGDEYTALINAYKEAHGGKVMESEEEIYKIFTKNVQRNLHVVFTMNPSSPDFSNRAASSPAIFNRCVINWFGDWSDEALLQVVKELTADFDLRGTPPDSLVDLMVKIHNSVRVLNAKLKKSAKKFNYMTPRDFLDFIRHFGELLKEKNKLLTQEKGRMEKGLEKLKETEETVNKMKVSLAEYDKKLEQKNKEANEKLEMITQKQAEAEEKVESSNKLNEKVSKKKEVVEKRKRIAQEELDSAGPALEKARNDVENLDKNAINETRSYKKVPARIEMALQGVFLALTGKILDWKKIKSEMGKSDFISKIVKFDTRSISEKLKDKIMKEFINKKEWDIKGIYKASKAAGPLADWLTSQMNYARILTQIKPLENEIAELNADLKQFEKKQKKLDKTIKELNASIDGFKKEYSSLIAKVESLKREKEDVNNKIEKSFKLLKSLSSERSRWEKSSKTFDSQFKTLVGDVLLSSALLTYIGFFDQFYRNLLFQTWKGYLQSRGVQYKLDLSVVEYLSKPNERMEWQKNGLPSDDICRQNAVILSRFNRYPLVIDPSGQAYEFLLKSYPKITKTSFIDDSFLKQLETALRFGLQILIQDVENIDPILNSILNKETIKRSGRTLIRVGDQEVDFTPSFNMFMITRNSEAKFTPDLCSRVTFVNFTVTLASLENQFINMYLRNERPEVEQKRINLLKLQGEFIVKLKDLEDNLLFSISSAEGDILENDEMIATLDNLKQQSTIIQKEMDQSTRVLMEVEETTNQYKPLANTSSKLFFALKMFSQVSLFYQFSLKYYLKIIVDLLDSNEKLSSIPKEEYFNRIDCIESEIFLNVYFSTKFSVKGEDQLALVLRFAQIKLESKFSDKFCALFKQIFAASSVIQSTLGEDFLQDKLERFQLLKLEHVCNLPGFEALLGQIESDQAKWVELIDAKEGNLKLENIDFINQEELGILTKEMDDEYSQEVLHMLVELLLGSVLRPQNSMVHLSDFVKRLIAPNILDEFVPDMVELINEKADKNTPILMATTAGFDVSSTVYDAARKSSAKFEDCAIGSPEAFELAGQAIERASKRGGWVILKNVHLAPSWLNEVEQNLHRMNPHQNFRLILLMEFTEKIPVTILNKSIKIIVELADGIKISMNRALLSSTVSAQRINKEPLERARLHFLLLWSHCVIIERLRYTPIGWSKKYEFNESDLKCAMDVVDELIDKKGARTNISLDVIPWKAIQRIVTENVYGGKIDNIYDEKILWSIVEQHLNPNSYSPANSMIDTTDPDKMIMYPDATKHEDFYQWIKNLKKPENPFWSGLPASANDVLKIQKLQKLFKVLNEVQDIAGQEIESLDSTPGEGDDSIQVNWLAELAEKVSRFIKMLPPALAKMTINEDNANNPLFRYLDKEVNFGAGLLKKICANLKDVDDMANGRIHPLQEIKNMGRQIHTNQVPKDWKKYTIINNIDVTNWVTDFNNRLTQLNELKETENWQQHGMSLGHFFYPEAFFTASRQLVSQRLNTALDELELRVGFLTEDEEDDEMVDENSFLVTTMYIEGVNWTKEGVSLSDSIVNELTNIKFTWKKIDAAMAEVTKPSELFVPIYLNNSRANLLMSIKLDVGNCKYTHNQLYQRGIAFVLWRI